MTKQKITTDGAIVIATMPFGQLESGFFRIKNDPSGGRLFFAAPHGRWTYHFEVLEDGTVSCEGSDETIYPSREIEVVDHASVGIMELTWAIQSS